jgi:hypothetical protein
MKEFVNKLNCQDPINVVQKMEENVYLIEGAEDEMWKLESVENLAHEINSAKGKNMASKRKYSAF